MKIQWFIRTITVRSALNYFLRLPHFSREVIIKSNNNFICDFADLYLL
jgi:hypothetical protein